MTTESSGPPPGWYPDPAGARQWRIWNGREWTDTTRPYGDAPPPLSKTLVAVRAHHALARYGVVSYFAGIGLMIDAYHHRPALLATTNVHLYSVFVLLGFALFAIGHFAFTRATSSLLAAPHWVVSVPLVNVVVWSRFVALRCSYVLAMFGKAAPSRRESADAAMTTQLLVLVALGGFGAATLPPNAVLSVLVHLIPAFAVVVNLHWARLLRDDLTG